MATVLFVFAREKRQQSQKIVQEIPAGRKQAELVLADGRIVSLQEGINSEIIEKSSVISIADNKVVYSNIQETEEIEYHTIRTPHGGEFTVTLSDGTLVWLNAISELRYPVKFSGDIRGVILTGEAYFEVEKSEKPFIVSTGNCDVKVLGTTFNLSAYPDDRNIVTTLCEGRVAISVPAYREEEQVIIPGEQLIFNKESNEIEIRQVDGDIYTAWIRGQFQFDNSTAEEVFNVLERWYDINVIYGNEYVKNEVFTGVLPRFDDLRIIMELIEKISPLTLKQKGNTIVVL